MAQLSPIRPDVPFTDAPDADVAKENDALPWRCSKAESRGECRLENGLKPSERRVEALRDAPVVLLGSPYGMTTPFTPFRSWLTGRALATDRPSAHWQREVAGAALHLRQLRRWPRKVGGGGALGRHSKQLPRHEAMVLSRRSLAATVDWTIVRLMSSDYWGRVTRSASHAPSALRRLIAANREATAPQAPHLGMSTRLSTRDTTPAAIDRIGM